MEQTAIFGPFFAMMLELAGICTMGVGAVSASPRVHAAIAILITAATVVAAFLFFRSAPLL